MRLALAIAAACAVAGCASRNPPSVPRAPVVVPQATAASAPTVAAPRQPAVTRVLPARVTANPCRREPDRAPVCKPICRPVCPPPTLAGLCDDG